MDANRLASRLREIVSGPVRQRAVGVQSSVVDSRETTLETTLSGTWTDACFLVDKRVEPVSTHGSRQVSAFASDIGQAFASANLLARDCVATAPLLFFDLETTGLNGGAGTYAFLIGCGWFDDDGGFETRQYVLTRLADERAVLSSFARQLARAGTLVSFNGRTFDAPLLESRFLYQRIAWPGGGLPHLDTLHPARRFWGTRNESSAADYGRAPELRIATAPHTDPWARPDSAADCSLASLERRLLGVQRVADVPGAEIPARYFQFVRSGDARPLVPVLEHNRLDLLSLAGIAARLMSLVHHGCGRVERAQEALALGRVYSRAGADDRAESAWLLACSLARREAGAQGTAVAAMRALARAARRAGRFEESADWWQKILRTDGCPRATAREAHEALAIHHEHRLRDLGGARRFTLRILDDPAGPAWATAVKHRLARLERKMGLLDF